MTQLRAHLERAQTRMKTQADKHCRDVEFQVGDAVYLKLHPYYMRSLAWRLIEKLGPKFFRPYIIMKRIDPVAYKLDLPIGARLHSLFHVSQLRAAVGATDKVQPLPAGLIEGHELIVQPTKITEFRPSAQGSQVLIFWDGLPNFEATWEVAASMRDQLSSSWKAWGQGGRFLGECWYNQGLVYERRPMKSQPIKKHATDPTEGGNTPSGEGVEIEETKG